MLFNSIRFLIFFPTAVIIFFAIPNKWRNLFLLAASYYFYMSWKPEFIILLLISTAATYLLAIRMAAAPSPASRKMRLVLILLVNIGMLFGFKYLNFFSRETLAMLRNFNIFLDIPALKILLPIGISFYTLQAAGYAIDIYKEKREPEKKPINFALFLAFFPQVLSGPIGRSTQLLPQFYKKVDPHPARISDGLRLMLWGFFKKLVICDKLSIFVDKVYTAPSQFNSIQLLIAAYFYSIQIYCDFSGYTDIARGAARVMGYELMLNFRSPYLAQTVGEFWRRWHISLSSWFRDYLYIPLGGNRVPRLRLYLNLAIVFLVSGLWHGANWTFIAWGGLHGAYMIASVATARVRSGIAAALRTPQIPFLPALARTLLTFHLVTLAWIFFRADSIHTAFFLITHIFTGMGAAVSTGFAAGPAAFVKSVFSFSGIETIKIVIALVSLSALAAVEIINTRFNLKNALLRSPIWLRWPAYYTLFFWIIVFGEFGDKNFIYFQF